MLRFLAPGLLQERGVEHFDAWAGNFAEAVTALELAPDGSGYRMHTRFAKFGSVANGVEADLVRCILTRKRPALFRGRHFEDVIISPVRSVVPAVLAYVSGSGGDWRNGAFPLTMSPSGDGCSTMRLF